MNCHLHHRLFLILCVCVSVCACLRLINGSPKIKRSHFLLVTPVTRVQLQDGCVFLWPAAELGGRERERRRRQGAGRSVHFLVMPKWAHTHEDNARHLGQIYWAGLNYFVPGWQKTVGCTVSLPETRPPDQLFTLVTNCKLWLSQATDQTNWLRHFKLESNHHTPEFLSRNLG